MPLFQCSDCGCVEDTALCHYWSARLRQASPLCSACDPKIARWHGEFDQRPAEGWTTDKRGFLLWNRSDVECWLGRRIEVIAKADGAPPRRPAGPSALQPAG